MGRASAGSQAAKLHVPGRDSSTVVYLPSWVWEWPHIMCSIHLPHSSCPPTRSRVLSATSVLPREWRTGSIIAFQLPAEQMSHRNYEHEG